MAMMLAAATLVATGLVAGAQAQSVTCADYVKADKQISAAIAHGGPGTVDKQPDAQTAAVDQRVLAYCTEHPAADLSKAMDQALQ
jgi:hypothetical protein